MRSLELAFGALRLTIAVFTVLLIAAQWTGEQAVLSYYVWLVAAVFCVYSLFVHEYVTRQPSTKIRVYAMSAFIDMAYISYLVLISGGPRSAFYPLYIVLTALHAYYFGMIFGLVVGTLSSTLYFLTYLNVAGIPAGMSWVEVVFRVSLAPLTAFFCGVLKAREQLLRTRLEDSAAELYSRTRGISRATSTLNQRIMALYLWAQATGEGQKVPVVATTLEDAIGAVLQVTEVSRFAVFGVDPSGSALALLSSRGLPKSTLSVARPALSSRLLAHVFQVGTPQVFPPGGSEAAELYGPVGEEVTGPMLIIPMVFGSRPLGVLTLHRTVSHDFAANEIDFFAQMAQELGAMLAPRLFPEAALEAPSEAEILGEAFVRAVEEELDRPRTWARPLSIALISFASRAPAGALSRDDQDRLAARGLAALEREMRRGDRLVRYGEAILGAIFPGTPENSAERLTQRLNVRLQETLREDPLVTEVGVVVSAGVATFPRDGRDTRTLIAHARQALEACQGGELVRNFGDLHL